MGVHFERAIKAFALDDHEFVTKILVRKTVASCNVSANDHPIKIRSRIKHSIINIESLAMIFQWMNPDPAHEIVQFLFSWMSVSAIGVNPS